MPIRLSRSCCRAGEPLTVGPSRAVQAFPDFAAFCRALRPTAVLVGLFAERQAVRQLALQLQCDV